MRCWGCGYNTLRRGMSVGWGGEIISREGEFSSRGGEFIRWGGGFVSCRGEIISCRGRRRGGRCLALKGGRGACSGCRNQSHGTGEHVPG
eukprot:4339390-Pyramimonas_sp.AAC.1